MILPIQNFCYTRSAYLYQQPEFKGRAKALYAGSFDPITKGHLDVIQAASSMFDRLVVLIAKNPAKKGFLPVDVRAKLIKDSVSELRLDNVAVDVAPSDLLTVDYARANQVSVLVRGLRTVTDFDSEMQLAEINKKLNKDVRTVFLTSNSEYSAISSSAVRGILACNGDVNEFVPQPVAKYLHLKTLWGKLKTSMDLNIDFDEISKIYNPSDRSYHNWYHIHNVIAHIDDFNLHNPNVIKNIDELKFSAFMHDAFQGADDIRLSCEKAKSILNTSSFEQVIKNIQATDHSKPLSAAASIEEKVIADSDLAILGGSREKYLKYAQSVRNEYSQYSQKEYAEGRIKVLESFLKRDRIFLTDYFYSKYEAQACRNIGEEIDSLRSKLVVSD